MNSLVLVRCSVLIPSARQSNRVLPVGVHDINFKIPVSISGEGNLGFARGVTVYRNLHLDKLGDDKRCREQASNFE